MNKHENSGTKPTRPDFFWDALCDPARRPFAVELDSPAGADMSGFLTGARMLRDGGAELLTVADCPFALPRIDASLAVCRVKRELGMNVMPHLTCRDRNRNALQALLLGLSAEGVGSILIVTGDPILAELREEIKGVYNFKNSRELIRFVDNMNREKLPAPLHIFAALNVNAQSFSIQLELAKEKEENGALGFFTQPVLTDKAMENLSARQDVAVILVTRSLSALYPAQIDEMKRDAKTLVSEIPDMANPSVDTDAITRYIAAAVGTAV